MKCHGHGKPLMLILCFQTSTVKLFLIWFIAFLLLASCSMRYGHLPKVKSKQKASGITRPLLKQTGFLAMKYPAVEKPCRFPIVYRHRVATKEPVKPAVRKERKADYQDTAKPEVKQSLTPEQMRFGKANWKDAWQVGFIIGLVCF